MRLPDGVARAIIDHARQEAPRECCGLLIGTLDDITSVIPAQNVADEPLRRYRIDPRDHLRAIRLARQDGEEVVGAYHSHPRSPALPSPTDAAEGFANFLFVIVSLASEAPEITGWRWTNGNFDPVAFVRVP